MEKIFKENNIQVISDSKFKFVTVRISFLAPLEYKDIAAYNLLIRLLTTRNSKYKSIDAFNTYLENNYGMMIRGGYFNRGNVGIFNVISTCMNSKYSIEHDLWTEQVNLLKNCIFDPYITIDTLNEAKNVYINKLKEQLNKKTYILKKKIHASFGNDNPYGVDIESDIESIKNVTIEEIETIYNKLINSQCHIYICGDIDEQTAIDGIYDSRFKKDETSLLDLSYLKSIESKENQVFESNFLQSAISLIYECDIVYNDRLYYALKVFLEMFNYDLFNIIREKYNYCYYIYAMSNNYLITVEIVSEIESKNIGNIISIIEDIIKGYNDNFNTEQFGICKNKIFTYIKNSLDSAGDLIDLHFGFDFNGNIHSIKELEDQYASVSEDEVKEVANMLSLKIVSILKEANKHE